MGYLAVDASFEHTLLVVGHIGQHRREMRPAVFSATLALRRAGSRTEADYQGRSLKAQFKQADKHNAELCVVIGPDEVAAGTATIRDMKTHEQTSVAMSELASAVAERLA